MLQENTIYRDIVIYTSHLIQTIRKRRHVKYRASHSDGEGNFQKDVERVYHENEVSVILSTLRTF